MVETDIAARLRLLYELGCAFAARLELDELLALVMTKCREAVHAEGAAVLLLDSERRELYFPYLAEEDPEVGARLRGVRFPADKGIAGAVLQSGTSLRTDDPASDPRHYGEVDRATGRRTRCLLTVPLTTHAGTVGVLQVLNRRDAPTFTEDDLTILESLAGSIAVAIENARLYAEVKASEERLRTQVGALRRDLARRDRSSDMIGTAPAMAEVFRLMDGAAASPISVLVEGETGTGKELVARGIHRASARAEGPFLAVNCAALTETLLASELFGYRRGAFTGAIQDHRGLFEAAGSGTIFLDEIGEMPLTMQAKLLRVLQEGEVIPVGDTRPRRIDVRVISATNRDLAGAVKDGSVRADLYYRLAAFPIRLPPLRERREDIPLLAQRALAAAAERHHKRIPGIEPDALDLLMRFDWPGNVRELENEIERAVALGRDGQPISAERLSDKVGGGPAAARGGGERRLGAASRGDSQDPASTPGAEAPTRAARGASTLRSARAAFEARYLSEVLRQQGGNVSRAAQVLGLSRVMLHRKMKEYGLR